MTMELKTISKSGIPDAVSKAELYRFSTNRRRRSRSAATSLPSSHPTNWHDDAILRWNRCARLLQSRPDSAWEKEVASFDAHDTPPV